MRCSALGIHVANARGERRGEAARGSS